MIQNLVISKGGSKSRPSEIAYYTRVDGLFARRQRRSATSSTFSLTGRGYLAYKAGRESEKASKATRDGPSSPKGSGRSKSRSKDVSSGVSQKDSSSFYS